MATLSPDVTAALATLRTRWGTAAPARAASHGDVVGALATVPLPASPPPGSEEPWSPDPATVHATGFAALDAILGPGGLPRGMGLSLRGDLSSGRTTIALRLAAAAQAGGAIVAWLDAAEAFDPVEAIARGVRPEWLVVVTPADLEEAIAIAGSLLSGRTVDLIVLDLPQQIDAAARVADRLGRLAALARRAGISLVALEPPGLASPVLVAIGEATGIRLELSRQSWIRLGRDVVGQRTEVVVARNRAGPPGRRASLRILYADGGERDRCLRRDDLLACVSTAGESHNDPNRPDPRPRPVQPAQPIAPLPVPGTRTDATPPLLSTPPPPRPRETAPGLRALAGGSDRPRRPAVVRGPGPRRRPDRASARRQARDVARVGAPAGAGGDVPRAPAGG